MENVKLTSVPFKTDNYSPSSCFLGVLGIPSSIRESISASDKSSNFESAKVMV